MGVLDNAVVHQRGQADIDIVILRFLDNTDRPENNYFQ